MKYISSRLFPKSLTLIELIIIIIIIGILVVIGIPRFNIFYSIKLRGAVKKIVSDIRYIQSLAISRHDFSRIIFDVNTDSYKGYYYYNGRWVPATDPLTRGNLELSFSTDTQYGGVDIIKVNFGGGSILVFNWEGRPQDIKGKDCSGGVVLKLGRETVGIYVVPKTGEVVIKE
ncbi:MAG: hypothetical protein DRP81_03830 [Candidatus Omnitrophota bacterium]|nr:MAG: hypothetical protein DRP81_03830 [Candidatus Omnitrophota bacterium]